jgi:hypothetical protein
MADMRRAGGFFATSRGEEAVMALKQQQQHDGQVQAGVAVNLVQVLVHLDVKVAVQLGPLLHRATHNTHQQGACWQQQECLVGRFACWLGYICALYNTGPVTCMPNTQ